MKILLALLAFGLMIAAPALALDVDFQTGGINGTLNFTTINATSITSISSSFPVPVTFSANSFSLPPNSSYSVVYNFTPTTTPSGTYSGTFYIVVDNSYLVTKDFSVMIPKITNFSINLPQSNITIGGSSGKVEYDVQNIGNYKLLLGINSDCNWLSFPNQTILPFDYQQNYMTYSVSKNRSQYDCQLNFTSDGLIIQKNITFRITDTESPVINSFRILPPVSEAMNSILFQANISDNFNATRASVTISGQYLTMNFDLNYTEEGMWRGRWTPEIPDTYRVYLSVRDAANNGASDAKDLVVTPISSTVVGYSNLDFYTKKFNQTYTMDALSFMNPYQVNISLVSLKLTNLTPGNFHYVITTPNEILTDIPSGNMTYLQPFTGTMTISVYADFYTDFDATLRIQHSPLLNISDTIRFFGRFSNTTFTPPHTLYLSNVQMDCAMNSAQTNYVCSLGYPPDVDISQLLIPFTQEQYNNFQSNYQLSLDAKQKDIENLRWILYIVIALLILGSIAVFVWKEVWPRYMHMPT